MRGGSSISRDTPDAFAFAASGQTLRTARKPRAGCTSETIVDNRAAIVRGSLIPSLLLLVGGALAVTAYNHLKPALFLAILTGLAVLFVAFCLEREWRKQLQFTPVVGMALPLLAWWITDIWLLYLVMALVIPLAARRPADAAPLYLFALLLLPPLDTVIVLGPLKLFDCGIHDMFGLGAMARIMMAPRRQRSSFRTDLPVAALLLLLVFSTARDTSVTNILRVLINTLLDCAMPYYIFSRGVRSVQDAKLCMLHLVTAAAILSVILLYEVRTSWPIYNQLYPLHQVKVLLLVKQRGGVLRAGGPFLESTSIAMVLATCVVAAWLSRFAFRSRATHFALLALLLVGLTAPQSRGAWVGLILGTVAADMYRRRPFAAARRIALIGALGAALVSLAPMSPYLSDTLGMSEGSSSTVEYRSRLFTRGMEEFWKSPTIGYSPPQVLIHLSDLRQGEGIIDFVNTYIFIMLVSGMIGLTIFVGIFLYYLCGLWVRRAAFKRSDTDLTTQTFVFAGLAMPMEMLIFTSLGGRVETMLFILFGLGTSLMVATSANPARIRNVDQNPARLAIA
jgi:hypothetical protein